MGTTASISMVTDKGTIKTIYCNFDGMLSHVGRLLSTKYTEYKDVDYLISLGDLSSLGENIDPDPSKSEHSFRKPQDNVCVFYNRDRGETDVQPRTYLSALEILLYEDRKYNYIFKDGEWYLVNCRPLTYKKLSELI